MNNLTSVAANGTANGGNPNLLCTPADGPYIVEFIIANYLAHALTVLQPPAATMEEKLVIAALALFLPATGAFRAVRAIREHPITEDDKIKQACMSGALCMVVKKEYNVNVQPDDVETQKPVIASGNVKETPEIQVAASPPIQEAKPGASAPHVSAHVRTGGGDIPEQKTAVPNVRWGGDLICADRHWKVHGLRRLVPGYTLAIVPQDAVVTFRSIPDDTPETERKRLSSESEIASSVDTIKVLISIGQLLFAVFAVYRAQGDQIQRYGVVAFGLTVIPYAWMSLINLVANLSTPSYPCLYMIWSPDMDAAIADGALIDGVVGGLDVRACGDEPIPIRYITDMGKARVSATATFICCSAPLGIIVGYWRRESGNYGRDVSTAQYGWIIAWYFVGCAFPLILSSWLFADTGSGGRRHRVSRRRSYLLIAVLAVPAIGGMVQVGRMLVEFGNCVLRP